MAIQLAVGATARNDAGIAAALPLLRQRFGDRYADSEALRQQHGHTTTWLVNQAPDAVVFPETTEEVVDIVHICLAHGVPMIPFGVGSSLEGHVNAPHGGVSVDMSRMNRVLAVHAEDLDAVVEPGVTRVQLNDYLHDQGLFFPIDPGADATLGGMAATRASGTNAVRYGTMRDNVISLTAVMPDGAVVKTGKRAKKSSAGYDLTRLMIGSEGTLGIITELVLRLQGIPEAIAGGVVPFATVEGACNATILTIQSGIPIARIELLDSLMVKATNAYAKLNLPETPHLFVEFHGSNASVKEQAEAFGEIAAEYGGGEFVWATRPEERTRLWQARHDAYWAAFTLRPGSKAHRHRRLRADFAAGGMRDGDGGRCRREPADCAGRRPCRRRQFPPDHAGRHGRPRRGGALRGADLASQPQGHRDGGHLHWRARHRAGQDEISRD